VYGDASVSLSEGHRGRASAAAAERPRRL